MRTHVRFTERADGTYVHAPHGGTLLRGAHLHAWLTRLAPFLTGEHSVDELVRELPCGKREMVERLVGTLARGGYVNDAAAPPPMPAHGPTAGEARVFVCGSGPGSGPDSGPGSGPEPGPSASSALREIVRLGRRAGWRVRVAAAGSADETKEGAGAREGDLVVWVDGDGAAEPALPGALLCPVRFGDGEAWVGPVAAGTGAGAGAGTGAGAGARTGAQARQPGAVPEVSGAAAAVVAGQAVLLCGRHLAGREGAGSTAVRVDLSELTTTEHLVVAPSPAPCASRASVAAWWGTRATASEGELTERAGALVDSRTGLLREVSSGSWSQFPLWTCGAVLRDGRVVGAHGSTREAARRATLLRAFATCAEGPDSTRDSLGLNSSNTAWGWDLAASAPAPVLHAGGLADATYDGTAGAAGAGWDVRGAVAYGLRAAAEKAIAHRLRTWREPLPQVTGSSCALLEATGRDVRVFDVSVVLGGALLAHAVTLDGVTVALRCGGVEEALEAALAAWQAERDGNAPYAPYVAGAVPEHLCGGPELAHVAPNSPCSAHAGTPTSADAGKDTGADARAGTPVGARIGPLAHALVAYGARPVVVPLRGEAPCVVRVVLTGGLR